jgi:hypothetical protein
MAAPEDEFDSLCRRRVVNRARAVAYGEMMTGANEGRIKRHRAPDAAGQRTAATGQIHAGHRLAVLAINVDAADLPHRGLALS